MIAESYGLRPEPFYLGIGIAAAGLAFSVLFIRDTASHLAFETTCQSSPAQTPSSLKSNLADATWRKTYLVGLTQAGLVKNLNDGVAWGIFPLYLASQGLALDRMPSWSPSTHWSGAACKSPPAGPAISWGANPDRRRHGVARCGDLVDRRRRFLRSLARLHGPAGVRHRPGLPDPTGRCGRCRPGHGPGVIPGRIPLLVRRRFHRRCPPGRGPSPTY